MDIARKGYQLSFEPHQADKVRIKKYRVNFTFYQLWSK